MYRAIYREYRPMTFDQVVGQNHIVETLKNQIKTGSTSHSYLFTGVRGTGKTSMAKIFSRAINCLDLKDGNPCNLCENCLSILDESVLDVLEMDAASNRGIDDIRELREKAVYPPSRLKKKVYIIDEVHMLTNQAFNALLKTLEEPPGHLVFILATTEPERLPETILSRTQRFDFHRIKTDDIISQLEYIARDKEIEYDLNSLRTIANKASGGMRDALSLLDKVISFSQDKITYEKTIEILGILGFESLYNIVEYLRADDISSLMKSLDMAIEKGVDIGQFLKDILDYYRNLLIAKTTERPEDILSLTSQDLKLLKGQAESLACDYIIKAIDILLDGEDKMKYTNQARILLELSLLKISRLENLNLEERICRLEEAILDGESTSLRPKKARTIGEDLREDFSPIKEPIIEGSKKEVVRKEELTIEEVKKKEGKKDLGIVEEKDRPVEKPRIDEIGKEDDLSSLDLEGLKKDWSNILDRVKESSTSLGALLLDGDLSDFTNNTLTISYRKEFKFHYDRLNTSENKEFLQGILRDIYQEDILVGFRHIDKEDKPLSQEEKYKDVIDFFGKENITIKGEEI